MVPISAAITGVLFILVSTATAFAHEDGHGHGAHEHGIGQLSIAVDGALVQLELETPAANLFGFEHRPQNDEQQSVVDEAVDALKNGGRLFAFDPPEARCVMEEVRLLSSLLEDGSEEDHHDGHDHNGVENDDDEHDEHGHDEHQHDDHDEHANDEHEHEEHADLFAAWKFECAEAGVLQTIDARGLFRKFPGFEQLRVQAVTGHGQTAQSLTADSSRITW